MTTINIPGSGATGDTGSVQFNDGNDNLGADSSNLHWDDTNDRLGIGTNTPSATLDVAGDANIDGYLSFDGMSIGGDAGISGDLTVSGAVNVGETVSVDGYTSLNGASIAGNVGISGDTVISGTINVKETATVDGYSYLNGFSSNGNAGVTGNFDVTGSVESAGDITGNRILAGNGSVSAPGISFDATKTIGLRRIAPGFLGIVSDGVDKVTVGSDDLQLLEYYDLKMSNGYIYDGSRALTLATETSTNHGLSSGDVLVGRVLEVDGYTWLDDGLAVAGNAGVVGDVTVSGTVNVGETVNAVDVDVSGNLTISGEIYNTQLQNTLDGYSTLTTAEGADGYIAFFTGSNSMAGDNDLFYNRATGDLTLGSGGNLSVGGGVTVGADGYNNLEVTGQMWSNIPGQLAPTGQDTTIDLNEGNMRVLNLANATGAFTVTLSNMQAGATYCIKIIQHASSPVTVSFSNSALWEGGGSYSATQSNSAVDFVTLLYDGTDFIGSYLLNLS